MTEVFGSAIENKIETLTDDEAIDKLVSEFPEELHDRLWEEVEEMDDYDAKDYLVAKLIDRKISLLPAEYTEVPKFMEVIVDNPEDIQESLEIAHREGGKFQLGRGHNGEVISSTRQDGVCYKTLFLERAHQLGVNVAREALLQHAAFELFQGTKYEHAVPKVDGFVKNADVQAIKMEQIKGPSLVQHMANPEQYPLPASFDEDKFFTELAEIISMLNNAGYFHRDLIDNAGNVLSNEDGRPVLIDFGSAVKACDYDPEDAGYQIVPNGQTYVKNDLSGVASLRKKYNDFKQAA